MVGSEVPSGSCLELHHGGTTKLTCVFHFTCAGHSSKLFVCVPLIQSSQDPYEVVVSIIPMSQWENWEIVKVLSDRQTLVQEQECWAVFHSPSFVFSFLTAYRSLAQKLALFWTSLPPSLWSLRGSGWIFSWVLFLVWPLFLSSLQIIWLPCESVFTVEQMNSNSV